MLIAFVRESLFTATVRLSPLPSQLFWPFPRSDFGLQPKDYMKPEKSKSLSPKNAAKEAADAAKQQFISSHRPHIRIKAVFLMSGRFCRDEPIVVRVVCVNRGVTEATIRSYGIECLVLRKGRPIPADKKIDPIPFVDESVLPSGISIPLPDFSYSITSDQEVGIRSGQACLYCMGFVHYLDGAKRTRLTAFCRVLAPDSFSPAPIGRFGVANEPDYEYED
jgi:hypothetical protein